MYYVRIFDSDNKFVKSHMLYEPPDCQVERSLLLGLKGHWIDVERIPIDYHSDSFCFMDDDCEDDEFDLELFILECLK